MHDPELDRWLEHGPSGRSSEEPTFVKNLERVQGDERDAIVLSIGYTKSADGQVLYTFGPLTQAGGERRLNVAVTRARKRMTLVSSFSHADLDPSRLRSEGMQMIGRYLAYAESKGSDLGPMLRDRAPLNPFEVSVRDRLNAAGIPLIAQYGSSGYWIDFAAQHPERPGQMVLAIECDGASYHSMPTARDRDRLRQEHLERLGWRFHRIWSTDWFRDPDRQVALALSQYNKAVQAEDHSANNAVTRPQTEPPTAHAISLAQRTSERPPIRIIPRTADHRLQQGAAREAR